MFVFITEIKQRKPRKESSCSPKKKGKGKSPWETDSEEEEEEAPSSDDNTPRPSQRTTGRRTAGGAV